MEEEMNTNSYSSSNIEVTPINKNCNSNTKIVIKDDNTASNNNNDINHNHQQTKVDAMYDTDQQVGPMKGGNFLYEIKDYDIIYKKKKINIKTENINKALLYIINTLNINNDCLFEVKLRGTKKISIYHFKNNKRKIINRIR